MVSTARRTYGYASRIDMVTTCPSPYRLMVSCSRVVVLTGCPSGLVVMSQ